MKGVLFRRGKQMLRRTLCLLLCCFSMYVSMAQKPPTVSLSCQGETLVKVIEELRKQTGYDFLFNSNELRHIGSVSADLKNVSLEEALNVLLQGMGLTYSIERETVAIRKAGQKPAPVRVKGVVKDEKGHPLPGVTVLIKGTTMGVVTDADGNYSLELPGTQDIRLLFSFIGMKVQEIPVDGKTEIHVTMQEDVAQMDEVVVTGYQTMKKTSMAGSVSSVRAEDLLLNGTQTLEQALQGQLPGVAIVNQSGLTGTRQKVRVRGTSTLVGNAEPVWVVDGIIQEDPLPFNASELTDIGDNGSDVIRNFIGGAISWLNPSDIDNVVVLKDASATAIYGVKAANGVIVITTKKGERGRLSLSYGGNFSFSSRMNYRKLELMNSKERVDASREAFAKGAVLKSDEPIGYMALVTAYRRREISYDEFNAGVKRLETMNTDWFDILFRTPFSHSHSINVSGGSNKTTYRASFGYNDAQNTAKGNSQKSYTANVNVSTTFWDKLYLTFGLAGNVSKTRAFSGTDPYGYASTTNRAIPCFAENGELYFYNDGGGKYNILNESCTIAATRIPATASTVTSTCAGSWDMVSRFLRFWGITILPLTENRGTRSRPIISGESGDMNSGSTGPAIRCIWNRRCPMAVS